MSKFKIYLKQTKLKKQLKAKMTIKLGKIKQRENAGWKKDLRKSFQRKHAYNNVIRDTPQNISYCSE